jgi:hypothetical protein
MIYEACNLKRGGLKFAYMFQHKPKEREKDPKEKKICLIGRRGLCTSDLIDAQSWSHDISAC